MSSLNGGKNRAYTSDNSGSKGWVTHEKKADPSAPNPRDTEIVSSGQLPTTPIKPGNKDLTEERNNFTGGKSEKILRMFSGNITGNPRQVKTRDFL